MSAQYRLHSMLREVALAAAAAGIAGGGPAWAAGPPAQIVLPASSLAKPADIGRRAHTNIEVMVPTGGFVAPARLPLSAPVVDWLVETPASLACAYRLVTVKPGCNPYQTTANPSGGSHAIAIVDAYNYPAAASDLAVFDSVFHIAAANFSVIYGTGSPSAGCKNGPAPSNGSGSGWDLEAALDIEWAHAMAPSAKLYLVEANSNSDVDLFNAVAVATKCVEASVEGQVSGSFGGAEFSGENTYDATFTGKNVVYFFAAGDSPGVSYPAASPNAIGVGGTTFSRNQVSGDYQSQIVWNINASFSNGLLLGTGGGPSAYEARPAYQKGVTKVVGSARGTPDLGALADVNTGVWIYNSTYNIGKGVFMQIGGTSAATPITAGIFNELGLFYPSSQAALTALYANTGSVRTKYVTGVESGLCGPPGFETSGGYSGGFGSPYDPNYIEATTGLAWNLCTGWGTPHGTK